MISWCLLTPQLVNEETAFFEGDLLGPSQSPPTRMAGPAEAYLRRLRFHEHLKTVSASEVSTSEQGP